jgi:hypothetical protein
MERNNLKNTKTRDSSTIYPPEPRPQQESNTKDLHQAMTVGGL